MHESYMGLMSYLEHYKDSICYEGIGMLPKAKKNGRDYEPVDGSDTLRGDEIWRVHKSGP